jgi:25S rRNA (cytosine2278-C5)-methyltransferase
VTTILNDDFTSLDPSNEMFAQVTHILLDPSCSGSGLERIDYDNSDSDLSVRLRNLSAFQIRLLKHAFLFPSVERIVYSTCSQYPEENERVVETVLNEVSGWRVLRRDEQPDGLRKWHRRGLAEDCDSDDIAQGCIRFEKGVDGTIGFFSVGFIRDLMSTDVGWDVPADYAEDDEEEWQGLA